jgi:hypothetical protein
MEMLARGPVSGRDELLETFCSEAPTPWQWRQWLGQGQCRLGAGIFVFALLVRLESVVCLQA